MRMATIRLAFACLLFASPALADGILVYQNLKAPGSVPFFGADPSEVLEDIHIAQSGMLRGFDVVLFNHTGVPHDAIIAIYAGDPTDGPPGALLAGPYTIPVPYSASVTNFHYDVPDYPMVERDLWFSVKFDVGVCSPVETPTDPYVGVSHHLFRYRTQGGETIVGPPYDSGQIAVSLFVEPPVPLAPPSWASLRSSYR